MNDLQSLKLSKSVIKNMILQFSKWEELVGANDGDDHDDHDDDGCVNKPDVYVLGLLNLCHFVLADPRLL